MYKGEFANNERNGRGKYTYKSGDIFDGLWLNDVREG